MNLRRFSLFLLCLLSLSISGNLLAQTSPWPFPARAKATAKGEIVAAFWNVEWFPGGRPNASASEETRQTKAVHADMIKLNPDVMGLEEMRDFDKAALAVQPLAGFKVDVCSNFPPREGQKEAQQVAIASRLPAMSAWAEDWKTNGAVTPPRGFAFAAYQLAPKQILLVYAVHLKSNRGELIENTKIREESVRQLLEHMKAMKEVYGKLGALTVIVGGDFNTNPDDIRFEGEKTISNLLADGLSWSWQNVPSAARITLPPDERFPAAAFDHILYQGATLLKAWVEQTSPQSSDHRAICASFKIPGQP